LFLQPARLFCFFFFRSFLQTDESSSDTIRALEERIAALEVGKQYEATKVAVERVETEMLIKLRDIRAAMGESAAGTSAAAGASKEVEQLREENAKLKEKNAKLEYRIQHMLSHMERLFEQSQKNKV
jgi:FtsZ-binding cell division protein ZapB